MISKNFGWFWKVKSCTGFGPQNTHAYPSENSDILKPLVSITFY